MAAQTTEAVNIVLIQTSLPLLTFCFSLLLLKQRPTGWQLAGLLFIIAGLLTVLSRGNWLSLAKLEAHTGDMYMLLAVAGWGLYTVLLKLFSVPLPGVGLLTLLTGLGAIMLMPFYLFELYIEGGFELNVETVSILIYITVFSSILSYLSWNNGVKVLGSNAASMFNSLMPVFTAVLALLILHEPLYIYHFVGGSLIVIGLKCSLSS